MYNGIYCIINRKDGKRYIGQSVHVGSRVKEHFRELADGRHPNKRLQAAYKKDSTYFNYEILEINIPIALLSEREEYWVERYQTLNKKFGYNKQKIVADRMYVKKSAAKKYDKK